MKGYTYWRRYYDKQLENERIAFERTTTERIKQNNLRLDIELEMVHASAQMRLDELLAGKSDEYRRGFLDGRVFESETTHAILNA